jgi:hypothetical protein
MLPLRMSQALSSYESQRSRSSLLLFRSSTRVSVARSLVQTRAIVSPSYELGQIMGSSAVLFAAASAAAQSNVFINRSTLIMALLCAFVTGYVVTKTDSVRFEFDDSSFAIVRPNGSSIGEHPIFGGEYRWNYDSDIINYRFLPNVNAPLFLYIKETKTPADKRIPSPILIDDLPGQVTLYEPAQANLGAHR